MSAEAEIKRVHEEADFRIAEFARRSPPPVPATPTPAASSKGGFAQVPIPDWREEMEPCAGHPQPHGTESGQPILGLPVKRSPTPVSMQAPSSVVSPQHFSIASDPESTDPESSDLGSDPGGGGNSAGSYAWPEEKKVYRVKHKKQIVITKLPTDATTHREWRSAFLACVSKVDMSVDDVWCDTRSHVLTTDVAAGTGIPCRTTIST